MKPIKPIRERKQPGVLSQADLYAQVKDSTERNRQFFFIWIAFALYVIVTTVATTDLQLLLPNSTVTLPALGIQLPLIGFFLVTPWLVLILHFNLLQNLDSHGNKLMQWANTYPNQTPPRAAIPAFLFDFAMLEHGGIFAKLTQVAAQLVFYAVGPLTIGILLWRFSDYQSWQFTVSQTIAFFCSIYLVAKASLALNQKHRLKVAFSGFNYWLVYVPIILVVVLQTYWVVALAFQTNKPWLFKETYPEVFIPTIYLPPATFLATFPSEMQTRVALDGEKNLDVWWRKYGVGAVLTGRNLKFATLSYVDLRNVDLSEAQLQDAELSGAKLQNAELSGARLINTYLIEAQLQGANLTNAQLQGTKLASAQLQGASLNNISVDANTLFTSNTETDLATLVFGDQGATAGDTLFTNISNLEKIFILRESLRDQNGLKLPDILYQQLFAKPTKYNVINSSGQLEEITGVGLRATPKK